MSERRVRGAPDIALISGALVDQRHESADGLGVTRPHRCSCSKPAKPYFFDSTHCATGRKPCR